jgi:hypothetical protein
MTSVQRLASSITAFLALVISSRCPAGEYTVKFNCWVRNGANGCQKEYGGIHPGIDDGIFNWGKWTSLGASKGSRIPNLSGKTIKAFHIKIDGTDDTFVVPNGAGGKLFPEVWRRKNGKEVLFNVAVGGSGIAADEKFWSYVYPQTPGYPEGYFLGKAFEERQPDPTPDTDWEKVPPINFKPSKYPTHLFPAPYQEIRTYADAGDRGTLLVSDDDVLWINRGGTELRLVRFRRTIPAGVNRVTIVDGNKGEEFVLWKDGEEVLRLPTSALEFWPKNLIGREQQHK